MTGDELAAFIKGEGDPENLAEAWKRVKANKGAPGIDGMRIEDFPDYARQHWPAIRQALHDGSYQPQPVRRVSIPKPNGGGERLLGIPCIVDRVIQQAIAQVLGPIFDPGFSDSSFGFRPGRSAHGALRQVQGYLVEGYRVSVDLDLAKFFDNVSHDVLMHRVGRQVRDQRLLALIAKSLRAPVFWSVSASRQRISVRRKAVRFRRCSPISCWTTWTRNWNGGDTDSSAMRMIS